MHAKSNDKFKLFQLLHGPWRCNMDNTYVISIDSILIVPYFTAQTLSIRCKR